MEIFMKFINYNLKEYIYEGLKSIDFFETTEVQSIVIPKLLNRESVIVRSATGSGKTHSFIIPMLQNVNENLHEVQAIVISPTRELALQLFKEINKIIKFNNKIDCRLFVGGTDRDDEVNKLRLSQPQIVVATIGKLDDLISKADALNIHTTSFIAVDEADMVFSDKDSTLIDRIFAKFEKNIYYSIFSATMNQEVSVFCKKYIKRAEFIELDDGKIMNDNIDYVFIPCKNRNKFDLLLSLLKSFKPYLVLIFANTKITVNEVANYLGFNDIDCVILTGDLPARERKQVLRRIKNGEIQYVVASDIASRGIDIEGVSHVINFELPKDIEYFIHRVGRTARYKFTGQAISFYDYDDDKYMNLLRKKGLSCKYMDLKDGQLVASKIRTKKRQSSKIKRIEEDVHMRTPMPKKVKPGYKKKRKKGIDQKLKMMKHKKIDEMFFKNIHRNKRKDREDE